MACQLSIYGLKLPLFNLPYGFYLLIESKLLPTVFKGLHKPSPAFLQLHLLSLLSSDWLFSQTSSLISGLSHLFPFPAFLFLHLLSLNPIHPPHVRKESFLLESLSWTSQRCVSVFPKYFHNQPLVLITLYSSYQFTWISPHEISSWEV